MWQRLALLCIGGGPFAYQSQALQKHSALPGDRLGFTPDFTPAR